jgi:dihydrolipoamide dehydrogenase
VGRGALTEGLGYEQHGVTLDRGFVPTDERLRTNLPSVYAVGDIVPGPQLAHRGFQQGIFVAEEIAGLSPPVIDEAGIPRVTYCDPEVASVGLTEHAAREQYGADKVGTYTYHLGGNLKSNILKTQGMVKLVRVSASERSSEASDAAGVSDGPVVGLHMVGSRVSELVGEAQLIYNWEAYPADVAQLVHMHPTQGEAIGEAHLALTGKPLHVHD